MSGPTFDPLPRREPALDGIRAFAILAVIAFHNGFSWLPGGFYGVDTFFVLSGFLITSLLIEDWTETGAISLRHFYARRARRLLPALFLMVAGVGVLAAIFRNTIDVSGLTSDAWSSLFYYANWHFMTGHSSYFAALAQPSPLVHTWSLAIEEQFYLVWPLVVLAVLRGLPEKVATKWQPPSDGPAPAYQVPVLDDPRSQITCYTHLRERRVPKIHDRRRLWLLLVVAVCGAIASAVWMAILSPTIGLTNRAYYGTDTRAQGLLVGASLAIGFSLWGPVRTKAGRRALALAAIVGAIGCGLTWSLITERSRLAFHGGFLFTSLSAAAVVAGAARAQSGPISRVLSLPPLRYLGRISYGVYLWYWPVLLVISAQRTGFSTDWLFVARVSATVAIAAASYHAVEYPILHGGLFKTWRAILMVPVGASVALVVVVSASTLTSAAATPTQKITTAPITAPKGTNDKPVKVLVVGDSMAGSLAAGLNTVAGSYDVQIINEGSPGCSLAMGQLIQVLDYTIAPGAPCKAADPDALLRQWKTWVDEFNPDVVVYLSRGETYNTSLNGQWVNLDDHDFDTYVAQRYKDAVHVLSSKGAAVVLMTTPYYSAGTGPSGDPWPEDDPSRVRIDNTLIHLVAEAEDPSQNVAGIPDSAQPISGPEVRVFDFGGLLSPDDGYTSSINGVDLRCQDGVHMTVAGDQYVAPKLLPELVNIARSHTSHPQSAPVPKRDVPPAVPSWYKKLNC